MVLFKGADRVLLSHTTNLKNWTFPGCCLNVDNEHLEETQNTVWDNRWDALIFWPVTPPRGFGCCFQTSHLNGLQVANHDRNDIKVSPCNIVAQVVLIKWAQVNNKEDCCLLSLKWHSLVLKLHKSTLHILIMNHVWYDRKLPGSSPGGVCAPCTKAVLTAWKVSYVVVNYRWLCSFLTCFS